MVVSIVALLVSILLPSLGKARGMARRVHCLSNLRQLGVLVSNYSSSSREWVPTVRNSVTDWWFYQLRNLKLLPTNVDWASSGVTVCPSALASGARFYGWNSNYVNYGWSRYLGDKTNTATPEWATWQVRTTMFLRPHTILLSTDGPRDNNTPADPNLYWIRYAVLWSTYSLHNATGPIIHDHHWGGVFADGHAQAIASTEPRFSDNPNTGAKAAVSYWTSTTANNPPFTF